MKSIFLAFSLAIIFSSCASIGSKSPQRDPSSALTNEAARNLVVERSLKRSAAPFESSAAEKVYLGAAYVVETPQGRNVFLEKSNGIMNDGTNEFDSVMLIRLIPESRVVGRALQDLKPGTKISVWGKANKFVGEEIFGASNLYLLKHVMVRDIEISSEQ